MGAWKKTDTRRRRKPGISRSAPAGRVLESQKSGGPVVVTMAMTFLAGFDESGSLELLVSHTGAPVVRCPATGRSFAVSWNELVRMARAAGIDRPAPGRKDARR